MRLQLLSAPLIIKEFVSNEPNCNYEIYLRELLNVSIWFKEKYPEGFIKPKSESNGECDAINENYKIDFKLFASSTSLRARSELYPQISKLADGVVGMGESKKRRAKQKTTRLYAAVRGLSLQRLKKIRHLKLKYMCIKKDIQCMLKVLETKKNLLLFFPYTFSFESGISQDKAMESIANGLENDFRSSFQYRQEYAPCFETFLTCIYDNSFIIFKIVNERLSLCDIVNITKIPTFYDLFTTYDD